MSLPFAWTFLNTCLLGLPFTSWAGGSFKSLRHVLRFSRLRLSLFLLHSTAPVSDSTLQKIHVQVIALNIFIFTHWGWRQVMWEYCGWSEDSALHKFCKCAYKDWTCLGSHKRKCAGIVVLLYHIYYTFTTLFPLLVNCVGAVSSLCFYPPFSFSNCFNVTTRNSNATSKAHLSFGISWGS